MNLRRQTPKRVPIYNERADNERRSSRENRRDRLPQSQGDAWRARLRRNRVPAKTLVDYLKAGHTLEDFLDGFPSVSREQAVAYLEMTLDAADLARVAG